MVSLLKVIIPMVVAIVAGCICAAILSYQEAPLPVVYTLVVLGMILTIMCGEKHEN